MLKSSRIRPVSYPARPTFICKMHPYLFCTAIVAWNKNVVCILSLLLLFEAACILLCFSVFM